MSESEKPCRVMLVDDHPIVRQGMRAALEGADRFTIVGEADNAEDAISATQMLSPDLVMLDIRIKGGRSGIEVANELRELMPDVKIITLTNHAQEPYLKAMIEAGVDGYLLKDTPPAKILEAITKVVDGERVFSTSLGRISTDAYIKEEASGDLSSMEAEILQMVSDGVSNQQIARDLSLQLKEVQMHLARSIKKLGASDRESAIKKALEAGIIVNDEMSA